MVTAYLESFWLTAALRARAGSSNNRELAQLSAQWLAKADAPLSLLPLADLPLDATREEVAPLVASVFADVGVDPSDEQVEWLLAAAIEVEREAEGATATARRLRSLAIAYPRTAQVLNEVIVLADDLDDEVPSASAEAESVLDKVRTSIEREVERATSAGWAWPAPIDQLIRGLEQDVAGDGGSRPER